MANKSNPQKVAQTRQLLKDTLIQLWNKQKCSLECITVKKLCLASAISRNTFYSYYDSIFSLAEEIENELLAEHASIFRNWQFVALNEYKQGDPFPCLYEMHVHVKEKEAYYKALIGPYGDPLFTIKSKKLVKELTLTKLLYDGIKLEDADFVLALIASTVVGFREYWLFNRPELTPLEVSSMLGSFIYGKFYNFNVPETMTSQSLQFPLVLQNIKPH